MTDVFDIKKCNVVRKVDIGEALEVVGGQQKQDSDVDISRVKLRATRDGKEGWVTLKGNQGTEFVKKRAEHYVANQDINVRQGSGRDSAVVRQLKKGEVFEGKQAPKEEKPEAKFGVKVRAFEDGK